MGTGGRPKGARARTDPPSDSRILGDKDFSRRVLRNRPLSETGRALVPLSELIEKVSLALGVESDGVQRPSKKRDLAEARGMICYMAIREFGYLGIQVGRELNLGSAGVSRALKRAELVFREKPEIKKRLLSAIVK